MEYTFSNFQMHGVFSILVGPNVVGAFSFYNVVIIPEALYLTHIHDRLWAFLTCLVSNIHALYGNYSCQEYAVLDFISQVEWPLWAIVIASTSTFVN